MHAFRRAVQSEFNGYPRRIEFAIRWGQVVQKFDRRVGSEMGLHDGNLFPCKNSIVLSRDSTLKPSEMSFRMSRLIFLIPNQLDVGVP
jgi:hypothetical protein